MNSDYIFEFTSTIKPPTKNIEKYLINTRTKKKYKNKNYFKIWDFLEDQFFLKRFNINKYYYNLLDAKSKSKLLKSVTDKPVILSLWNGFKRQDLSNILTELQDRLEGIAYLNDRQIKETHLYKDESSKVEYFKVIVEYLNY